MGIKPVAMLPPRPWPAPPAPEKEKELSLNEATGVIDSILGKDTWSDVVNAAGEYELRPYNPPTIKTFGNYPNTTIGIVTNATMRMIPFSSTGFSYEEEQKRIEEHFQPIEQKRVIRFED